jgi:DNA-directed RNA polymerase subunit omega
MFFPRFCKEGFGPHMNVTYLDRAKDRITNIPLLINMVSRRVRQLNNGQRPLSKPDHKHQSNLDIALKEIADGKLTAEFTNTEQRTSSTDNLIAL